GQAFVHLDDAVEAFVRIVDRRANLPSRFPVLIGEPETIAYGALQDAIAQQLYGHDWPTIRIPASIAKLGAWLREKNPLGGDPFIRSWMIDRASDHYELDISEADRILDWQPEHTVLDTIPEMIHDLGEDRGGWYAGNGLRPPHRILPI